MASNVVQGCRSNPHVGPAIFSRAFSAQELDAVVLGLNLNTSPVPDGIHGQMISHLGPHGENRLLDLLNESWRLGRLPPDWKKSDWGTN
ncbi:RNase H domain-containing protein [Trichonephila clavipes]|nr:RNase H domain-containing protein [Trichonephila clavipes]